MQCTYANCVNHTFLFSLFLDLQIPIESWTQTVRATVSPTVVFNSQPNSHQIIITLKVVTYATDAGLQSLSISKSI